MMRHFFISILTLLSISESFCQEIAPGGVKNPLKWFVSSKESRKPGFKSLMEDSSKLIYSNEKAAGISVLNFNPSLYFSVPSQFSINLKQLKNSFSLFTVYNPADTTNENCIWHFSRNNKPGTVLTTDRAADLNSYKYINFIDLEKRNAKVNIYL